MKKYIFYYSFSAFFILSITSIQAQEKCKYKIDKTDPFTNKPIRTIDAPIMYNVITTFQLDFTLEKIGDDYDIAVYTAIPGTYDDYLEKGDSIMVKFADNSIVTCYAKDRGTPKKSSYGGNAATSYGAIYPISIEKLKTYSTSLATILQINIGARKYTVNINDKNSKRLMKGAACIMQ
jgi:hypothetical protein